MRIFKILPVLALAALGGSLAARAPDRSEPAAAQGPLLVADVDGGWSIIWAIGEEPVPLEVATRGLIVEEKDERIPRTEADEAAERAFEEAIDQARREERPR